MSHLSPRLLRHAIAAAFIALASGLWAQGRFIAGGRLKIEGSDLAGARAVVYKNGVKERTITTGLNKFQLDLELNAQYIVSFEKDGYVAKKLSFDTRVPAEAVAKGFTPFEFAVSLFKQYDDLNLVVFNQPVGMIRYSSSTADFDYDTDYTKSIQSQLQEAVAKVERKQKQEAQAQAEAAKRQGEEAKARAKAEAEAKRQAEAEAAAAAKAKAETERAAAAQAKAQAEAEKAAAAQAKAQAEAERKAALEAEKARAEAARKEAPAPLPPAPKPAPVPKAAPPPPPSHALAKPVEGEDGRRSIEPVVVEEPVRVAKALPHAQEEAPPEPLALGQDIIRTEDLLVEPAKVTTVVQLEVGGRVTEYRRVSHKWGGVFYFKDGQPCTALQYEQEALPQEQLAGATPRGKFE